MPSAKPVNDVGDDTSQLVPHARLRLDGQPLLMPRPATLPPQRLIGHEAALERILAAWFPHADGLRLNVLLVGPPGVGKNQLVYEVARVLQKDVYILQGHEDIGAEDLTATARVDGRSRIEYVASPLLAAMDRGQIAFIDEIGKMSSRALAPLASVLDDRRTLQADPVGSTVVAHPGFLFVAACNEDDDGLALPVFLAQRLRPVIQVPMPPPATIRAILAARFPPELRLLCDAVADAIEAARPLAPRIALGAVALAEGLRQRRGLRLTPAVACDLVREALSLTAVDSHA